MLTLRMICWVCYITRITFVFMNLIWEYMKSETAHGTYSLECVCEDCSCLGVIPFTPIHPSSNASQHLGDDSHLGLFQEWTPNSIFRHGMTDLMFLLYTSYRIVSIQDCEKNMISLIVWKEHCLIHTISTLECQKVVNLNSTKWYPSALDRLYSRSKLINLSSFSLSNSNKYWIFTYWSLCAQCGINLVTMEMSILIFSSHCFHSIIFTCMLIHTCTAKLYQTFKTAFLHEVMRNYQLTNLTMYV